VDFYKSFADVQVQSFLIPLEGKIIAKKMVPNLGRARCQTNFKGLKPSTIRRLGFTLKQTDLSYYRVLVKMRDYFFPFILHLNKAHVG
jgi:hypothetical protein